jgi:ABC-type nitrate/sulfonate/bicarbonate transport system ATPase subunit
MIHIMIRRLCKSYPNRRHRVRDGDDSPCVPVLNDINLGFEQGHMVCVLGPSGCGKTTMLRIIAGFESPTSGEVLIDDKPVVGPTSDNIFVFQQSGLLPWMTVAQNIELGLRHLRDEEKKQAKIQEAIGLVDLIGFEDHYPNHLSGGMKRRAELARALVVNPKMLIMDEPFSGLDFLTHLRMREEVVNMHEMIRKTTLIVTHDINDAIIMSDHLVVMSDRPSRVKLEHTIKAERPRNYETNKELAELRDEIFFMLGVHYAV